MKFYYRQHVVKIFIFIKNFKNFSFPGKLWKSRNFQIFTNSSEIFWIFHEKSWFLLKLCTGFPHGFPISRFRGSGDPHFGVPGVPPPGGPPEGGTLKMGAPGPGYRCPRTRNSRENPVFGQKMGLSRNRCQRAKFNVLRVYTSRNR